MYKTIAVVLGTASTDLMVLDGSYPFSVNMRRPYSTTNPTNGCCQDVFLYNVVTQECCVADDGDVSIEEVGNCVAPSEVEAPDSVNDFNYSKK